ncbi:MAG: ParA family protein [Candidatus Hydrogenedentota bacterium]
MPNIIAIANQKGGVGKTTTIVNLAASLAAGSHKTLIIDLDPQSNATQSLGISLEDGEQHIYDLLVRAASGEELKIVSRTTDMDDLHIIPGFIGAAALERELAEFEDREFLLKKILSSSALSSFDYILLDTPPGLGILTINALAAAGTLIIPVQSEYLALEGLTQMVDTVERIRENFNPELLKIRVLITLFDHRLRLARAIESELRTKLSGDPHLRVCKTMIHRNVRLAEAPSFGLPIILFDPSSSGSDNYIELSKEVMNDETTRTGQGTGYAPVPLEIAVHP